MAFSFFSVRDFLTGGANRIRSTVVNPTSPDVDIHLGHHVAVVAPTEDRVSGTGSTTAATTTAVGGGMVAPGASKTLFVDAVQVANKGATAVLVTLQDGSGGAALAYVNVVAGATVPVVYPSPLELTANTGLYFQADGTTTTLYVSAQGHTE